MHKNNKSNYKDVIVIVELTKSHLNSEYDSSGVIALPPLFSY